MSIRFYIYQSKLPSTLGKFIPKTLANNNITINELVERVAQSKTSLGKGDIRGVIETLCEVIELEVTSGSSVQLGGICQIRPSIRGTFDSITGGFDPDTNSIEVAIAAGQRLRKAVKDNASVEKIANTSPSPDLVEFTDIASGDVNTAIQPGRMGQIDGTSLSFDEEQADEGLFIVTDHDATPVKATVIQKATTAQIVFEVPEVSPQSLSGHFLLRRRNKKNGPPVEGQSATMDIIFNAVAV